MFGDTAAAMERVRLYQIKAHFIRIGNSPDPAGAGSAP
jgi:hypothetical protein